jgi:hypothetical protein
MNRHLLSSSLVLGIGLATACGPTSPNIGGNQNGWGNQNDGSVQNDVSQNGDGFVLWDAAPRDGTVYQFDAHVGDDGCPASMSNPCNTPVDPGTPVTEICGNGLDDDWDGVPDNGCTCAKGSVQPCFNGPPAFAGIGACVMGEQTCVGNAEFGHWGDCIGGISPSAETCDGLDNDCNGCIDDGLCCTPPITCPDPTSIVDAQPFVDYPLDGTLWYTGPANSWDWTVQGGPCEPVLGNNGVTITSGTSATPTFVFTLSGDYTVTMTVHTPAGDLSCSFIVHVAGPGLRVELCWEEGTTFSRDIDLHLLREDFAVDWCDPRDCYYADCKGSGYDITAWGPPGYTDGPLSECENVPDPSSASGWTTRGSCGNPRLDVDNISDTNPQLPENINVDAPEDGHIFRTMVHYYGCMNLFGTCGEASPLVNIYCDGHRISTFGQAPDLVTGFANDGGGGCMGSTWRVADVETTYPGGTLNCAVTPLYPNGQVTGYRVLTDDTTY